jgi:hypothetical protein
MPHIPDIPFARDETTGDVKPDFSADVPESQMWNRATNQGLGWASIGLGAFGGPIGLILGTVGSIPFFLNQDNPILPAEGERQLEEKATELIQERDQAAQEQKSTPTVVTTAPSQPAQTSGSDQMMNMMSMFLPMMMMMTMLPSFTKKVKDNDDDRTPEAYYYWD